MVHCYVGRYLVDIYAIASEPFYVVSGLDTADGWQYVHIQGTPGRTNISDEEWAPGWFGETANKEWAPGYLGEIDNQSLYVEGKFDTFRDAVARAAEIMKVSEAVLWAGLRRNCGQEIDHIKLLVDMDGFDAEHAQDDEEREYCTNAVQQEKERLKNLLSLQTVLQEVALPLEVKRGSLQGRILDAWQAEETVKSIAAKLSEDENKIRVIFNRLVKAKTIHAIDQREGNYKIYIRI
jgi:hypothetical protein